MRDLWREALVGSLLINASLGLGYRVYRRTKGGPVADVIGQSILACLLSLLAAGVVLGWAWPRWAALIYGLLFALAVMPVWALAVLIPLPPGKIDYAFAVLYWMGLVMVIASAVAM